MPYPLQLKGESPWYPLDRRLDTNIMLTCKFITISIHNYVLGLKTRAKLVWVIRQYKRFDEGRGRKIKPIHIT
jgi:hypothetical protein